MSELANLKVAHERLQKLWKERGVRVQRCAELVYEGRRGIATLTAERDEYREALNAIVRHTEIVAPGFATQSTTVIIATNALNREGVTFDE